MEACVSALLQPGLDHVNPHVNHPRRPLSGDAGSENEAQEPRDLESQPAPPCNYALLDIQSTIDAQRTHWSCLR